jgi:multidrug resistance efflux pump
MAGPSPTFGDPLRRWTLIILAALAVLFVLQIASDRTAPVSRIATVEALAIPIAARIGGEVVAVAVRDNQAVDPGTVMFSLDPTDYLLRAEQAEANLAAAGQRIGASTERVAAAQAALAQARAGLTEVRARTERTLELVDRGVAPAAQADTAREERAGAEARVAAAEADLRGAQETLGPTGADNPEIRAAAAALEAAEFDLARTDVRAPIRGFVTNLQVGAGLVIQPGQAVGTLIGLESAWIVAWFRENQLAPIDVGDAVEIVLDVRPGEVLRGRVAGFAGGVATPVQTARPGGLVSLPPGFLGSAQRHGVVVEFEGAGAAPDGVRLGSQATVMVDRTDSGLLAPLWWLWLRAVALMSYAA